MKKTKSAKIKRAETIISKLVDLQAISNGDMNLQTATPMKSLLNLFFPPKPQPRNTYKVKKLNISHTVHPTRPFKYHQDFPVNTAQL